MSASSQTPAPQASPVSDPTRRVVVAGAAGISVVTLAACSSGSTTSPATAAPGTATGASTGGASTASGTKAGSASSSATVLAKAADVPVGGGLIVTDAKVVVTQPTAGSFSAFSVACPHKGCAVNAIQGSEIICPCHNSKFGLNGAVIAGPATSGLTPVAVKVADGSVVKA